MGRMIIDAATSLDGFWVDVRGRSVFQPGERDGSSPSGRQANVCGAVVMSRRTFELSEDVGWIEDAYAAQTPVFVVTEAPTGVSSGDKADGFQFLATYAAAFSAARLSAGDRAVLVVGEGGALKAALRSGEANEIWLRMLSRTLGQGASLFEDVAVEDYFVSEMETTPDAVHMHLERRLEG